MAETVGGGPSKFATFFGTRVAFTKGEKDVGKIAQGLNALGNALLAPTRHLMKGRTATCVTMGDKTSQVGQQVIFGNIRGGAPQEKVSGGKAVLSAIGNVGLGVLALVGTPLGALVKGLAMISPDLRKRCNEAAGFLIQAEKDETHLLENLGNAIVFIKKEEHEQMVSFLHHMWSEGELNALVTKLCEQGAPLKPIHYEFLKECLEELQPKLPKKALPEQHPGYRKVGIEDELQKVKSKLPQEGRRGSIAEGQPRRVGSFESEGVTVTPYRQKSAGSEGVRATSHVEKLPSWRSIKMRLDAARNANDEGKIRTLLEAHGTDELQQTLTLYEKEYGDTTMVSSIGWEIFRSREDRSY
jgi:hypothetical protein